MFCVYVTEYLGDKLPKWYVGSSSISKVNSGYKGSVSSYQWKSLWESEPDNLFVTRIISEHITRKDAFEAELKYQIDNDVVKSDEWVNKSLAQPDGFFGMDVSGKNNPMYGKSRKGETHKGGENISKALQYVHHHTSRGKELAEMSSKRMKLNNPSKDPETLKKMKNTWKSINRCVGEKNGMYGKTGRLLGKKLYNNGQQTKAYNEGSQPDGWILGRHKNQ